MGHGLTVALRGGGSLEPDAASETNSIQAKTPSRAPSSNPLQPSVVRTITVLRAISQPVPAQAEGGGGQFGPAALKSLFNLFTGGREAP